MKVKEECAVDTLFFPDNNVVTIADSLGSPLAIPFRGLIQVAIPIDSSKSLEEMVEEVMEGARRHDTYSSSILGERLAKISKEMKENVGKLYEENSGEFPSLNFDEVVFENYISNDLSSEARQLDGKSVIFMNDRLLDFCTWMSDLILSSIVPEPSGETFQFPLSEEDYPYPIEDLQQRVRSLIYHYLYDCPIEIHQPSEVAIIFRDYMEMFVLSHEYAHIALGHLAYGQAYGELLSEREVREVALNRWMHELQADVFSLNVLITKYYQNYETNEYIWITTAGSFYLACIEILERARMELKGIVLEEGAVPDFEVFDKLINELDPFPFSFSKSENYVMVESTERMVEQLVAPMNPSALRSHPPSIARADILLGSMKLAMGSDESIRIGIEMCRSIQRVFEISKEALK